MATRVSCTGDMSESLTTLGVSVPTEYRIPGCWCALCRGRDQELVISPNKDPPKNMVHQ